MLKKIIAFSLITTVCLVLSGCTVPLNPDGLPKSLDNASHAKKLAYCMNLAVPDQPAPKGFDANKGSQLLTDVALSATVHRLNAIYGTRDIGSFGAEFGLALGKAIFSVPPESTYHQAMVFLPDTEYRNASEAAISAVKIVHDSLKKSVEVAGYEIVGGEIYNKNGIRFRSIDLFNPAKGCPKSKSIKEQCYIAITAQERKFPDQAEPSPSWLTPNGTTLNWQIRHIRIEAKAPETAKLRESMPKILANYAREVPPHTWLYVAPMQVGEQWTAPYVSDGTNAYFFIKPEAPKP